MSKQKEILITHPFEEELLEKLSAASEETSINSHPAKNPEEIPDELWEKCEILYTMNTLPLPEQAPNLRWIQFHLAGIDRVVDAPILQNPEIAITTLSGVNSSQVAEYTLTMLLALSAISCLIARRWIPT